MKKIFYSIMSLFIIIGFVFGGSVKAADLNTSKAILKPNAVIYCSGSSDGLHHYVLSGFGNLYKGDFNVNTKILTNCDCWQCKYCYDVMITAQDPVVCATNGTAVGKYGEFNPLYKIQPTGINVFTNTIFTATGSSILGCRFAYTPY